MTVKIQVVTITDDGQESTREITCVERQALTPETFGLSLAEGKAVLHALQEVVVEWQMHAYFQQHRFCPHCGKARRSKGVHHTVFRTVFGALPIDRPRLYQCPYQAHATASFSPLATLLPERTTPDLLYLETKWAALMSYGLTVKLLQDVLPIDEPLEAVTIRNHVLIVAQGLEDALGEEHWSFIVTMRLTGMQQTAKSLPATTQEEEMTYVVRAPVTKELDRLKWFLWHGNVYQAVQVMQTIEGDLDVAVATSGDGPARQLRKAVEEFHTYITNNAGFIPHYGERYRQGERIRTGFVESTVHQVVSKRMVQKQQMRWSKRGAHLLLQIRTRVLNGAWEATFRTWYPGFRAHAMPRAA